MSAIAIDSLCNSEQNYYLEPSKRPSYLVCGDMKRMAVGLLGSVAAAPASQSDDPHASMGIGGLPWGRNMDGRTIVDFFDTIAMDPEFNNSN